MVSKGDRGREDMPGMNWFWVNQSFLQLIAPCIPLPNEWVGGGGQTSTPLPAHIWQTGDTKGTQSSYTVSKKQCLGKLCIGARLLYHVGRYELTIELWGTRSLTHCRSCTQEELAFEFLIFSVPFFYKQHTCC